MKTYVLFALLLLFGIRPLPGQSLYPGEEVAIQYRLAAFSQAVGDGDAKGFAQLFAADGSLVPVPGQTVRGRGRIEAAFSGVFGGQTAPLAWWPRRNQVHFLQQDAALTAVEYEAPASPSMSFASGRIQAFFLLAKEENQWQIRLLHTVVGGEAFLPVAQSH